MKKILLSLTLILFVGSAFAVGSTGAFFSDTELSRGNTFTAGAIDLKIDNTSYYNGVFNQGTSWELNDLTIHKFFDFSDIKPGDRGEDTISIHVNNNDAYICANITLQTNDDNGLTEPEALVDTTDGASNGELASNVNFIWWADDGDNVLEDDEPVISQGPIGALTLGVPYPIVLADSDQNIWGGTGPISGGEDLYIAKAWCFGDIAPAPLDQSPFSGPDEDNLVDGNSGEPEDGGITCDGSGLNNSTQTDNLTADITFTAVQARHNTGFQCPEPQVSPATLTLVKSVNNGNVGGALITDWTLTANGPSNISGVSGSPQVTSIAVGAGAYVLGETNGPPGYSNTQYSCVVNGGPAVVSNNLVLASNDNAICTIVNTVNSCTDLSLAYADSVTLADQGRRQNGSAILVDRQDPTKALGVPQTTGTPSDTVPVVPSFYALGFNVSTTATRSLTVQFTNNVILNGPGNDVRVYEVTGGTYPDEIAKVEASQDGTVWTLLVPNANRDEDLDLGSLGWAKYIKITDLSVDSDPQWVARPDADGYDVDAVRALNCAQTPIIP